MKWTINIEVWNDDTKRYLDRSKRENVKLYTYHRLSRSGWIIRGEKKIKMSFGEINISKVRSKCGRCLGNIPKHRKRVKIYGTFNDKYTTAQYFHLDCYKIMMKDFLKDIKDNLKKVRLSKKYITEKEGDLLIQQL